MENEKSTTGLTKSNSKLRFTNNHIAFYTGGVVYVNRALIRKDYNLFNRVVQHELKHARGERHVDLREGIDWRIIKFVLTTPSSWTVFLPIRFFKGKILYDPILTWLWLILLASLSVLALVSFL